MESLSAEEENYVRMSLLLTGISPCAVRTYFDYEFAPTNLEASLKREYNTLFDLKRQHIINQSQLDLLFPRFPGLTKSFHVGKAVNMVMRITLFKDALKTSGNLVLPLLLSVVISDVPLSKNFDVTLMTTLLRHLTPMNPPTCGFDRLPSAIETTPAADLARIKHYRNNIAHLNDGKLIFLSSTLHGMI
ncbi:unnamed protein product [Mytilus edulis]|uniref:DZIP3-like HEPN domain-containing protein n=1 Tax=Mytilus edulis TaxID=6550 RepID=A0A8S3Q902_MYTED|nr:unnamed protein product [Mytilus edulis]